MNKKLSLQEYGLLKHLEHLKKNDIHFFSTEDGRDSFENGTVSINNSMKNLKDKGYIRIINGKNLLGQWQANSFELLPQDPQVEIEKLYTVGEFLIMRQKIVDSLVKKHYSEHTSRSMEQLLKTTTLEKINKQMGRCEINFGILLYEFFKESNIYFLSQYSTSNGILDFYNKEYNLAVEYDEFHHKFNLEKDARREMAIVEELHCYFIRVNQGDELNGLKRIFNYILTKNKIYEK